MGAIVFFFITLPSNGLMAADAVSKIVAAGLLLVWLIRNRADLFAPTTFNRIRDVAVRFRDYPLYSMPGALVTASLGLVVPVFMVVRFGTELMGQYALVDVQLCFPPA